MSLFPDRDLTPEERAAHDEDPRPGWTTDGAHRLDQQQTDTLIRAELYHFGDLPMMLAESGMRKALLGEPALIGLQIGPRQHVAVREQRGGLDSDPMVRLLAFRAWGDRDRTWKPLGDVDRQAELYRVDLGLDPWDEHRERIAELATATGHPSDRRIGRTTRGLLRTIAGAALLDAPRIYILARPDGNRSHCVYLAKDMIRSLRLRIEVRAYAGAVVDERVLFVDHANPR